MHVRQTLEQKVYGKTVLNEELPVNKFLKAVSAGKRHDAGMLRDSGLMDDLENHA